jgi:hypothetical protein
MLFAQHGSSGLACVFRRAVPLDLFELRAERLKAIPAPQKIRVMARVCLSAIIERAN